MTKKKNELEAMSPESTETVAFFEEEPISTTAEQGESSPGDDSPGDDLSELLAAMDGDPEDEEYPTMEETLAAGSDDSIYGEDVDLDSTDPEPIDDESVPVESEAPAEQEPPKPKRATRKKKTEVDDSTEDSSEPSGEAAPVPEVSVPAKAPTMSAPPVKRAAKRKAAPILTIEAHSEAETQENIEDTIWHEIHNAYRTRRMLTGTLGGIEQTDNGKTIVIVEYKGFRVIIPMKEMMINLGRSPSGAEYDELVSCVI